MLQNKALDKRGTLRSIDEQVGIAILIEVGNHRDRAFDLATQWNAFSEPGLAGRTFIEKYIDFVVTRRYDHVQQSVRFQSAFSTCSRVLRSAINRGCAKRGDVNVPTFW